MLVATFTLTDEALEFDGIHYLINQDITHNFNADEFRENGYELAITAADDGIRFQTDSSTKVTK